jgi:hypothetical protein
MKWFGLLVLMAVVAGAVCGAAEPLRAQTIAPQPQASSQTSSDFSAQRRVHRRATPVTIYGSRPLSPNAVRVCTDWYAQEYRPSGTVIVPHMSCHWVDR